MSSSFREAYVRALVENHFEDSVKAREWFNSNNPQLGNVSPNKMIELGRLDKLLAFVQASLAGYGI